MNDQFKVGTICIGQNFVICTERNNMECEVIGGLAMRRWHYSDDPNEKGESLCYSVRWADGTETLQEPYTLRRKPPKQSDSQWADEAIRKLKKQSSDHVVIGKRELIPEESL